MSFLLFLIPFSFLIFLCPNVLSFRHVGALHENNVDVLVSTLGGRKGIMLHLVLEMKVKRVPWLWLDITH